VFLCLSASFLQFAKRPGSIPGNGVFLCLSASFLQFAKRPTRSPATACFYACLQAFCSLQNVFPFLFARATQNGRVHVCTRLT
jgi:hypothetical protein